MARAVQPVADLYVCPWCQGEGEFQLLIDGYRWQPDLCRDCSGQGVVPREQWERWEAGRLLAADRKARGVTQAQEAARLGISPRELSNREWGRER
jgi:DnaJ-class molecular chaperone